MSVKGFLLKNGTTAKYDYNELDNLPVIPSGSGLSDEAKIALLSLLEKVAYVDENARSYYDALEAALYPPANLVSITATYTQGGTVYDTDTIDSLKPNLVVTANYDNGATAVISTYTLSGSLTAGTSTITVSYNGKSTTFNVTVTKYALYPLENGTFTFSNGNVVTVTNGKHVEITLAGTLQGWANISDISENTSTWNTADNVKNHSAKFTIPAGATAVFEISNLTSTNKTSFNAFGTGAANLGMDISNVQTGTYISTKTFESATDVGCLFAVPYAKGVCNFDVSFVVDGVRYV